MKELKNRELACKLSSLCVFRDLLEKKEIAALLAYLKSDGDMPERISLYCAFVNTLEGGGGSFSSVLKRALCESENAYITKTARGEEIDPLLRENTVDELKILSEFTAISAKDLCESIGYEGYLPVFNNESTDLLAFYMERSQNVEKYGYGVFASYPMFRVENGEILPVTSADPVSVGSFVGYSAERKQVLDNTAHLAAGRYAANVLLCGDAGTGKSSTVKAAANLYYHEGVRLIEMKKDQLLFLPKVMEKIMNNPLKFIIFIDDLSFNKNDDCFSMLKAALEGSSSAKAKNAAIYVTSNRRHIVKETFSDRSGDDVHRADTVEELMSLSGRFGLVVYFSKPSKQLYLEIVHELASRLGITVDMSELDVRAETFALAKGSRSPRTAEQFVKSLL